MNRLEKLLTAILTEYAGSEAVFTVVGARFSHEGATNRIVAYPIDGVITEPSVSAQGQLLADWEPNAVAYLPTSIDDFINERRVNVAFEIWAADMTTTENRLHALLCAIAALVNSTLQVDGMREAWPQQGDVTSGGATVVLFATFTILVIKSDVSVVAGNAAIGVGTQTSVVTRTEIDPSLDSEALAPATWEQET